jgi:murein DD-endopeptidase MepM/ murein hydrolase activator NlpD
MKKDANREGLGGKGLGKFTLGCNIPYTPILSLILVGLIIFLGGCGPNIKETAVKGDGLGGVEITVTPELTASPPLPSSPTPLPPSSTPLPPSPTAAPSPLPPTPTPCPPELCTYMGQFWLIRPILAENNDTIDSSYRYGSTQEGIRPTHHGVEFVNAEGTAVLAAADGLVIVAEFDSQTAYADFPFYYGNVVILEHNFEGIEGPVYTLYGHLSAIQVQAGNYVQAGDQLGAVGYTGVAEWSHLHFEVRVGKNRFRDTRNPELWIQPHQNEGSEYNGVLAGRIIDEFGNPIHIPAVEISQLSADEEIVSTFYVETYADFTINGDDVWGENFVVGDLEPGKYRVSFVARGLQTFDVEILSGQVTLLTFDAHQK